ncbi:hypothetical protein ACFL0W_05035 [Nanoarchaeota archaeon]
MKELENALDEDIEIIKLHYNNRKKYKQNLFHSLMVLIPILLLLVGLPTILQSEVLFYVIFVSIMIILLVGFIYGYLMLDRDQQVLKRAIDKAHSNLKTKKR